MSKIVLVTGGARSGKSSYAEEALWQEEKVCYIATGVVSQPDSEFQERILQHQARRPKTWVTKEQFDQLDALFLKQDYTHYLLDCVTMLTSNVLFAYVKETYPTKEALLDDNFLTKEEQKDVTEHLLHTWQTLLQAIKQTKATVYLVTNEVGLGIVPANRLSRFYRDIQGKINQLIAKEADEVYLVICGLSQQLK